MTKKSVKFGGHSAENEVKEFRKNVATTQFTFLEMRGLPQKSSIEINVRQVSPFL